MKTRILLLMVMLFAVFGLVACKETTTEVTTNVDVTEQVDAPQNLRIAGKVLSWDAVTNVTIYRIYVNGVSTETVRNATSYDFSALTGDSILFNVVAIAPTGYDDSPLSASIAYVANPATVIAAIELVATNEGMNLPDGVAAELVRKGMTGPIFQNDVDAIQTMQTAMETAEGDIAAMNLALTAFVADVENYEAYLSAFITVAPDMIDEQIASLEADRVYYADMLEVNPGDQYFIDRIAQIDAEIESLTNLKAAIIANSEQIVVTVMAVVNYLIDFHDQITDDLVTKIQTLSENADATGAEIMLVKSEITALLLDNLPSTDDLTLVFELLTVLGNAMNGNTALDAELANEYANAAHIMMEIAVRFIDSLDAAWIDAMTALGGETMTQMEADTERQILFILAFANFEADNQALIDSVEAVFTEAQKQAAFESALESYGAMLLAQGISDEDVAIAEEILADLTYALATAGIDVFDDLGTKALDYIVASDGELLRVIGIQNGFYEDYWMETYENEYTGDLYANYTEYKYAQKLNQADLMNELAHLLDATVATLTEAQVTALVDMVLALVPEDQLATETKQLVSVINNLLASLETTIGAQDQNLLLLVNSLTEYLVTNDVFADYRALITQIHTQDVLDFGANYEENIDYDKMYQTYALSIFMAHHLDAWLTTAEETAIDALVTAAFDLMSTADFLAASGLLLQDVTDMETMIVGMIDDVIAQAAVIAAYDVDTLTLEQETEIQNFLNIISGAMGGGS